MFELYGTKCRDLLGASGFGSEVVASGYSSSQDEHRFDTDAEDQHIVSAASPGRASASRGASDQPLFKVFLAEDGSPTFQGLAEVRCDSENDLLNELARGQQARATCETGVHDKSSRSHAFYRLIITCGDQAGELLLVDLAGSERNKDSAKHDAQLQREGAEINASLMALKNCFRAQAAGQAFVPFRSSHLTRILKQSLTDRFAKTAIIATVSPSSGDTEHTLSTLSNVSLMLKKGAHSLHHRKFRTEAVKSAASVKADAEFRKALLADPKRWSAERVQEWWREHAPPSVDAPTGVSGVMLARWPKSRFVQHCRDSARAAPTAPRGAADAPPSTPRGVASPAGATSRSPRVGGSSPGTPTAVDSGQVGAKMYDLYRGEVARLRRHQQRKVAAKRGPSSS